MAIMWLSIPLMVLAVIWAVLPLVIHAVRHEHNWSNVEDAHNSGAVEVVDPIDLAA